MKNITARRTDNLQAYLVTFEPIRLTDRQHCVERVLLGHLYRRPKSFKNMRWYRIV